MDQLTVEVETRTPVFEFQGVLRDEMLSVAGLTYISATQDLDGDGTPDLLVGDHDGNLKYFLRDPANPRVLRSPQYLLADGKPINWDKNPAHRWVDVNGDGKMDFVLCGRPGIFHWYENISTGPGTVLTGRGLFCASSPIKNPTLAAQAERAMAGLGFTPPSGSHPLVVADQIQDLDLVDSWAAYAVPDFIDLNGDGYFDMVVGTSPGVLLTYMNQGLPGTPRFHAPSRLEFPGVGYLSPRVLDPDGDGNHLLLMAARLPSGVSQLFSFSQPSGDGTPLPRMDMVEPFGEISGLGYGTFDLVDWNGDGKLDFIQCSLSGEVRVRENITVNGEVTRLVHFGPPILLRDGGGELHTGMFGNFDIADMNGDGAFDVLGKIGIWLNEGTDTNPVFTARSWEFNLAGIPLAWDLNGDGQQDFVEVRRGDVRFWMNSGGGFVPQSTIPFPAGTHAPSGACLADWNGDGIPDLLLGSEKGTIQVLLTLSSPPWFMAPFSIHMNGAPIRIQYNGVARPVYPKMWDWNRDGLPDLFLGDEEGVVSYSQNEGSPGSPVFRSREWIREAEPIDTWRDLYGYAIRNYYISDFQRGVTGFNPSVVPRPVDVVRGSAPFFVDLPGRDRADMFVGQLYGRVHRFSPKRPGLAFVDATKEAGLDRIPLASFGSAWGDVDNDGDVDLYINNHFQQSNMYLNQGDGTFTEISALLGLERGGDQHGASFVDYDNDGDLDLYQVYGSPSADKRNRLYQNTGVGFLDVTEAAGIGDASGRGRTPLWFDYDRDGLLDLLVANIRGPVLSSTSRLFRNLGNSTFEETTTAAGLSDSMDAFVGMIADVDMDQDMDLFAPFAGVYDNLGTTFRYFSPMPGGATDMALGDYDNDGDTDLYIVMGENTDMADVSGTYAGMQLRINRAMHKGLNFVCPRGSDIHLDVNTTSNATFPVESIFLGSNGVHPDQEPLTLNANDPAVQGAPDYVPEKDFGIYIWYDVPSGVWRLRVSAGPDYYTVLTAVLECADGFESVESFGFEAKPTSPNILLENQGDGSFIDVTSQAGVGDPGLGKSAVWGDFDNDGDLDLYVVNAGYLFNGPNRLYENMGNGKFREVAVSANAEALVVGRGESVTTADYNQDGRLDLLVLNGYGVYPFNKGKRTLLRNDSGNENHWIRVKPVGTVSNRDSVGAVVEVLAGGVRQWRTQDGGIHAFSQNEQVLHFGLGENDRVDEIRITWPSGITRTLVDLPPDQVLVVSEQEGEAVPAQATMFRAKSFRSFDPPEDPPACEGCESGFHTP